MKKKKRIICGLLVFILTITTSFHVPQTRAYAADNDFVIDRNGTLTSYTGIGGAITVPDGVITIGKKAFAGNTDITSVTLPSSVKTIEISAFDSCTAMTSITLSSKLTTIGDNAFWNCTSLKSVTIPTSVTTIGFGAFCQCDVLTGVYIPANVTQIGNYAFGYLYVNNNYVQAIDYTILGESGSAAATYADKYSISFLTKTNLKTTLSSVAKKTSTKMTVKWKKNTKVTGYQIQYSTSSKFTASKTKSVTVKKNTTVSKTISSLTKGKTYYVRIRGYRTIAGKTYYSAWGTAKKVTL